MKNLYIALFALAALTSFGGCTTTTTARYDQLQKSYEVARGTVLQIEVVTIDDDQNEHEGAITGALSGAVIGGDQRDAGGAMLGALIGGAVGSALDQISKVDAYQLRIRKTDGTEVVILQRKNSLKELRTGDAVEILTDVEGGTIVRRV